MGGTASKKPGAAILLEGDLDRRVSVRDRAGAFSEYGQWRLTRCVLDGCQLTYFSQEVSEGCQVGTTVEDFEVEAEDLRTLQFTLRVRDRGDAVWMIRAGDAAAFTSWIVALKQAKRPPHNPHAPQQCEACSRGFSRFRSARDCCNCGLTLCKDCCPTKGFLPHLGYFDQQFICVRCLDIPRVKADNKSYSVSARRGGTDRMLSLCCFGLSAPCMY